MPYAVVIERSVRGLDSPPTIQVFGVDVELSLKHDVCHALNQVERKGYRLASVQSLGDGATKYVFATPGSFVGDSSHQHANTALTAWEQNLLPQDQQRRATQDKPPAAVVAVSAPAPAPPLATTSVPQSGSDTGLSSNPSINRQPYLPASAAAGHVSPRPAAPTGLGKKPSGDQYQYRVEIRKMPENYQWVERDPSLAYELAEAMAFFEIPGGQQMKDSPSSTLLRSFWNKQKKDTTPFLFPDAAPVSETCVQKLVKALNASGADAVVVKTGKN